MVMTWYNAEKGTSQKLQWEVGQMSHLTEKVPVAASAVRANEQEAKGSKAPEETGFESEYGRICHDPGKNALWDKILEVTDFQGTVYL